MGILKNIHKNKAARIFFIPFSLFFGAGVIGITYLFYGMLSWAQSFLTRDTDLANIHFRAEGVLPGWITIMVFGYLVLLTHRSLRVVFGYPFYLVKRNKENYLNYRLFSNITLVYVIVSAALFIVLPEKG